MLKSTIILIITLLTAFAVIWGTDPSSHEGSSDSPRGVSEEFAPSEFGSVGDQSLLLPSDLDKSSDSAWEKAGQYNLPAQKPVEGPGLHNVFELGGKLICGSEPEDQDSFKYLAQMGVKTIISVDGKVPDDESAQAQGMKYVHIPVKYSGIKPDEILKLTKTFRELEGPFYVHCFHGKHRGPAAAAIGRLVIDGVSRDHSLAEMRQWCGTAQHYGGLYEAVASSPLPSLEETESFQWGFPAAHEFGGLRQAMVEMTRAFDHLKHLSGRDWEPDPSHPDIDAYNEAYHLAQVLDRCAEMKTDGSDTDEYKRSMNSSLEATREVRDLLSRLNGGEESVRSKLKESFGRVKGTCTTCHEVFRN